VLVGEAWVCSGQSNMEWRVGDSNAPDQESAKGAPANPMLRMFTVASPFRTDDFPATTQQPK
jgi:sialate O-acetylesterase